MLWGRKGKSRRPEPGRIASIPEGILAAPEVPPLGPPSPVDVATKFDRLGPRAWELLNLRRMRAWFPDESIPEFRRYHKLAKRTPDLSHELFIGLDAESSRPIFVPRHVLNHHAYVLGATGSGKTSQAVAQLLLQLGEPRPSYDHRSASPILIIDCKQEGDRYLRSLATMLSRMRGSTLRFFSNDSDYESLYFDPIEELRSSYDPIKFLETLLNAFGMIYPEGYGSDFFTAEQRTQLMEILVEKKPVTMDNLISFIKSATRDKDGNRDARGLYSAMASLGKAHHIRADGKQLPADQLLDLKRFIGEREILYVHLNTRAVPMLSRDVGRLLLYSLIEVAERRIKAGEESVQIYVAIDEFHRLAASNIVEMLNQARSAGISFILSHQTSSSLKTRDADLYGTLFQNCHFKQCLTLEDPRVIDLFTLIAGRKREIRHGGATALSTGTSEARARSWSDSKGFSYSAFLSLGWFGRLYWDPRTSETRSDGGTETTSTKTGRTDTDTWREEMVPGLTPEMITQVNAKNLLSLVHVKQEGDDCITPLHGIPTLVQGLYPFSRRRAERMQKIPWPLGLGWNQRESRDRIADLRSLLPVPGAVDPKQKAKGPERSSRPKKKKSDRRNQAEKSKLEARHRSMLESLSSEMLPQKVNVERFASRHGITVKETLKHLEVLADELDLNVSDEKSVMSPGLVLRLRRRLKNSKADDAKR